MTITIGVSQVATANRIFYDANYAAGATANYTDNAAIRLQSSDLSPISVEFSESGNEIGLIENNVGDTTFRREQRHLPDDWAGRCRGVWVVGSDLSRCD